MKKMQTNITGSHKVCGVIGNPITHTLSPLIHNALTEAFLQQSIYVPFYVEKDGLKLAIAGAHALGIQGLNITMPYKKQVMKYVTRLDGTAQKVGAVNTLVYQQNGYVGYNTDVDGITMSLEEARFDYHGKNVAIIGSGGAAYAAVMATIETAKSIHIFNRTIENAELLKVHAKLYYPNVAIYVHPMEYKGQEKFGLTIQTTGVGMGELKNQSPKVAEYLLGSTEYVMDMIYNPTETLFLKLAKEKGCPIINGWSMLFYQALRAYELMHQVACDRKRVCVLKKEIESVVNK